MKKEKISDAVIRRLPRYYRYLDELHAKGLPFDVICEKAQEYLATTHLFFSLKSLHNLAQNGRVSKIAAGAIGILGIHILATASLEGTIQPVEKCRGEKKTCAAMVQNLLEADYHGGKVRIHHAENPEAAGALAASLRGHFPEADIEIRPVSYTHLTLPTTERV